MNRPLIYHPVVKVAIIAGLAVLNFLAYRTLQGW